MGYMEEHGEHKGTVTILDTQTGCTVADKGQYGHYWAEGNGSCDCNREHLFGIEPQFGNCIGCERFLILSHNYPNYNLSEMNTDYPKELIDKHIGPNNGNT